MIRLDQVGSGPGRAGATLDQPLDHLLACHRRIEERLDVLQRAAAHFDDRRPEALEAIEASFHFLDTNGVWHTADEEESVFPRLQGRVPGNDEEFLRRLETEHREAERVYGELKARYAALSAAKDDEAKEVLAEFRAGVEQLRALYAKHIAAEDSVLIGLARDALEEADLAAIAREMKARRGLPS